MRSIRASTPHNAPTWSTTRYSVAGVACTALSKASPFMSVRNTKPGSTGRARSLTATHGCRCSGSAFTAASETNPLGLPSESTTTSARASASRARRTASETGSSAVTDIARRMSVRMSNRGSTPATLACAIAIDAFAHRNHAMKMR